MEIKISEDEQKIFNDAAQFCSAWFTTQITKLKMSEIISAYSRVELCGDKKELEGLINNLRIAVADGLIQLLQSIFSEKDAYEKVLSERTVEFSKLVSQVKKLAEDANKSEEEKKETEDQVEDVKEEVSDIKEDVKEEVSDIKEDVKEEV